MTARLPDDRSPAHARHRSDDLSIDGAPAPPRRPRAWSLAWVRRGPRHERPPLLSFSGRVASRAYVNLQLVSALLFASAIVFAFLSVRMGKAIVIDDWAYFIFADWAIAGAIGSILGSLVIGAGAVTRRARDGALPAIFIGLFYVINRLLLPVNLGAFGPPGVREIGLHLAFIMLVVQILLLVRGTMPDPEPLRL